MADLLSGGPFAGAMICTSCGQELQVTRGFGLTLRTLVCVNQRCPAWDRARETSLYNQLPTYVRSG